MNEKTEALLAELRNEAEQHKANLHRCLGAIAALEYVLKPEPVKDAKPAKKAS